MRKYTAEQKATIFVVLITSFAATFSASALNLSIPAMGKEFNVSASMIGWVVTCYMLTTASLAVPFGRLGDITQKKRVFVPGVMIFSLASLAAAFSMNFVLLLVLRAIAGVGGAMIFSTNMAILISAFPPSERGKLLGLSVASTYTGLSAGPVFGGILNHYLGWRSIFVLAFILSGIVFFTAIKMLPKGEKNQEKIPLDIAGTILYITMISAIICGFSGAELSKATLGLVAVGFVLMIFFIKHELKTESPIVQIRLFTGNIAYALSNLATLLNYGATFAIGYMTSIYLQVIMKYPSQEAGLIMITQPFIMALLSPYAGRLSDKISPYKLASVGMGLCAAGITFFIFISTRYPLWLIILALGITGVGFALFSSPNTNAIMDCVEAKDYGVASSIISTMRNLGQTTGMAILTLVISLHVGNHSLANAAPAALIKAMHTSFTIFVIICVIGIFISAQRKKK